jgi:hypothetical protein
MKTKFILPVLASSVLLFAILQFSACGQKTVPYDENLLSNPSFETEKKGLPAGWRLETFHGLDDSKSVTYGVTDEEAFEGERSFFIQGEDDTQRWLTLIQEIEVSGITHIRLQGSLKVKNISRKAGQYTHCNFVLMFYDKNHERFQELRYGDKRTKFKFGTSDWATEDQTFRVPQNTAYIAVGCLLGMTGTAYFDGLSLSVPRPADWVKQSTNNFDFYSLPGHDFPEGSMENQQRMFDHFCTQLGVTSDLKISYYFYPDSTTIREMLSLKGVQYVSWDDWEIHSIHPNNEHEIIHFITDQYGVVPKALAEGCVYYLIGEWNGRGIHELAKEQLMTNRLPMLSQMLNYGDLVDIDVNLATPAAASFFGFVYEQKGPQKILELFGAANGVNSYPNFAVVFERVYGVDLADIEKGWRAFLYNRDFTLKDNGQQP